jgi:hypothetical protein
VSTRYACRASAPEQGPVCLNQCAGAHRGFALGAKDFWNKHFGPILDSDNFADGARGCFN